MALAGIFFTSCEKEESNIARAVMASSTYLEFAQQNAAPKTITVYADAVWTVDAPDWITVSVTGGSGTVEGVTITAADNIEGGVGGSPRRDTVKFHGDKLISYSNVIVYQAGDKYRTADRVTVSSLAGISNGNYVVLEDAQVTATDASGFIISDGTSNAYLTSKESVKTGDMISLKGQKVTVDGMPSIAEIEDLVVKSNSDVVYPAATDITPSLDSQTAPSAPAFVTVSGVFDGSSITVEGASKSVTVSTGEGLDLSELAGHKVDLSGYLVSVSATKVNVVGATVKDNGLDVVIYFNDDFEWIAPWATEAKAGDAVATNNPSTTAPNVFTSAACEGFLQEYQNRGYGYIWSSVSTDWSSENISGDARVLYLQSNYLKFGKTSYSAGIVLPAFKDIAGTADVELSFDWAWQVTGAYKPDIMTLSVEIDGEGTCDDSGAKESLPIESAQSLVDGESAIEWQHVTIRLNGLNADSRVTIRPTYANPDETNPARHQNRWYLDNIIVTGADGEGSGADPSDGGNAFPVTWSFLDPGDEANGVVEGTDFSVAWPEAFVMADDKASKLEIVRPGERKAPSTLSYKNEGGYVRLLSTGMFPGDYWLFSVPVKDQPAGTYTISYRMSSSQAGPKFFVLEWSTDGENWTAFTNTRKTTEALADGSSPREVEWTFALSYTANSTSNDPLEVEESVEIPAISGSKTLMIRARVSDAMRQNRTQDMPSNEHGGTNRLGNKAEITFTAK